MYSFELVDGVSTRERKSELSSAAHTYHAGTARRRAISTVLRITGDRDGVEVTAASNAVNGTTCRIASRAPVRHGRKVMRATPDFSRFSTVSIPYPVSLYSAERQLAGRTPVKSQPGYIQFKDRGLLHIYERTVGHKGHHHHRPVPVPFGAVTGSGRLGRHRFSRSFEVSKSFCVLSWFSQIFPDFLKDFRRPRGADFRRFQSRRHLAPNAPSSERMIFANRSTPLSSRGHFRSFPRQSMRVLPSMCPEQRVHMRDRPFWRQRRPSAMAPVQRQTCKQACRSEAAQKLRGRNIGVTL